MSKWVTFKAKVKVPIIRWHHIVTNQQLVIPAGMVNTGQTGRMKTPLHSAEYMNLK